MRCVKVPGLYQLEGPTPSLHSHTHYTWYVVVFCFCFCFLASLDPAQFSSTVECCSRVLARKKLKRVGGFGIKA